MKVTVFQANKGDCLLLTGQDGKHLLVDGGLKGSFQEHVAPTLHQLREQGEEIDLVCVSHFDEDHIEGVLELLDNIVEWRVFDFQANNPHFPEPTSPRPPGLKELWHNAFQDQVALNMGEIDAVLVQNLKSLLVNKAFLPHVESFQNLVTSKKQALRLTHRISQGQLNIPLNRPAAGGLIIVDEEQPQSIPLGGMNLRLIGPFAADLENLRNEWNDWIEGNQSTIRDVREQAEKDAERLRLEEGVALQHILQAVASALGDREQVTPPNLASIMFLVQEDGKTVLLTGDGHGDDILNGLRKQKQISDDQGIHLDILKVQHHGSEFNLDEEFCRWVTADHYVFCGNGAHENPDEWVIQAIVDSRVGPAAAQSKSPQVNSPFKLWFNSSVQAASTALRKEHMQKVETLVGQITADNNGHIEHFFLEDDSSFEIDL